MPQLITVTNNNPSGAGSLADAITTANGDPGSTINFAAISSPINLAATLSITANVTINGPGPSVLTVQRDPLAVTNFSVFTIGIGVSVTISGLAVSNGLNNVGSGMIFSQNSNYTLNNMTITGNRITGLAPIGGAGIFAALGTTGQINNSSFIDNKHASDAPSLTGRGGGILNRGTLTLDNVLIEDNNSGAGGGIANEGTITAATTSVITNGAINTNGNGGGGIFNVGTGTFNGNLIDGNNSVSVGGGISNIGNFDISDTNVRNNHAISVGGGISTSGPINITATSIYRNLNDDVTGGAGLDIAGTATVNITNSTFTENLANDSVYNSIVNIGGDVLILSSTISNPTLNEMIVNISTGTYNIGNTVVNVTSGSPTDFVDLGGNFFGGNPQLLPLGNYGGPTDTMEPATGSPLINAGDMSLVIGIVTDQRGFPRVSGNPPIVDIGSVEVQLAPICYSGESLILAQTISTGDIAEIRAKDLFAGVHRVYDLKRNKFIPIKHNIITGPTQRFMKIEKNALGENEPNEDFFVTGGHKLLVKGKIVKASQIPEAKRSKVKPAMVYSICTEKKAFLFINGLTVLSWGEKEWIDYSHEKNIGWIENKSNKIFKNL